MVSTAIMMGSKIVGLDIRDDALSAVLVNGRLNRYRIESHAHIPFSATEPRDRRLTRALSQLTQVMDLSRARCMVGYPAHRMAFRTLSVPFKNRSQIDQIIAFELEPMLPMDPQNLIWDYLAVEFPRKTAATRLLTAALDKEQLDACVSRLAEFGLEPIGVVPSGFVVAACLARRKQTPANWALVDLDSRHYCVSIWQGQHPHWMRAGRLNGREPHTRATHERILETSLAAFQDSLEPEFHPDEIFVTGDPAGTLADIKDQRLTHLDMRTHVDTTALSETGGQWNPRLMNNALCLSLAPLHGIRGPNLYKNRRGVGTVWTRHKPAIVKTACLGLGVLLLWAAGYVLAIRQMQHQSDRYQHKIASLFREALPQAGVMADPVHQLRTRIQAITKTTLTVQREAPVPKVVDLLREISLALPDDIDVEFTQSVIGPEGMRISGHTDTFNRVDDIQGRLEKRPLIKKVIITSSSKEKTANRIRFNLQVEY